MILIADYQEYLANLIQDYANQGWLLSFELSVDYRW